MKFSPTNLLTLLATFFTLHSTSSLSTQNNPLVLAPLIAPPSALLVPDIYIITLHTDHTIDLHFSHIGVDIPSLSLTTTTTTIDSTFPLGNFTHFPSLNGYHAQISEEVLHTLIRTDPGVKLVEQDVLLDLNAEILERREELMPLIQNKDEGEGIERGKRSVEISTKVATEALAMLSAGEKVVPRGSKTTYEVLENAGEGIYIYVLDAGINVAHEIFRGRATNFGNLDTSPYVAENASDTSGRGTHLAGIVMQVAYMASIVNVKVFGEHATVGSLTKAIVDITTEHNMYKANLAAAPKKWHGSVILISEPIATSSTQFSQAIYSAYIAGIPIVVAAGDTSPLGIDANFAPCALSYTICVTACDTLYNKTTWSNYGSNIDIVGPGDAILSASHLANDAYAIATGSAQAAAFVAGTLSIYMGYQDLSADARMTYDLLAANGLKSVINGVSGVADPSVNLFVQTGIGAKKDRTQNQPYVDAPLRVVPIVVGNVSGVTTVEGVTGTQTFDGSVTISTELAYIKPAVVAIKTFPVIPGPMTLLNESYITSTTQLLVTTSTTSISVALTTSSSISSTMSTSTSSSIAPATSLLASSTMSTATSTSLEPTTSSSASSTIIPPTSSTTQPPTTSPPPPPTTNPPPITTTISRPTTSIFNYVPISSSSLTTLTCSPSPTPKASFYKSVKDQFQAALDEFCNNVLDLEARTLVATIVSVPGTNIYEESVQDWRSNTPTWDVYKFSALEAIPCLPAFRTNASWPMVGTRCKDVLYNVWDNCDNQNRGGSIMAGCWFYNLTTVY